MGQGLAGRAVSKRLVTRGIYYIEFSRRRECRFRVVLVVAQVAVSDATRDGYHTLVFIYSLRRCAKRQLFDLEPIFGCRVRSVGSDDQHVSGKILVVDVSGSGATVTRKIHFGKSETGEHRIAQGG